MAFLLIDDKFHSNPKIIAAGNAGAGLYVRLLAWCADNLTDGYVPAAVARQFGTKREIDSLVCARRDAYGLGLLDATDGGYTIPDFLDHNPSAAEVRKRREETSQVKARAGRAGGIASGASRRAGAKQERSSSEADRQQIEAPIPIPIPDEQVLTPPSVSTGLAAVVVEPSIKNTIVLTAGGLLADKEPAGKIQSRSAWVHSVAQRLLRDHGDWLDDVMAHAPSGSNEIRTVAEALVDRASGVDPAEAEKQAASGANYGRSVLQAQVDGDMLDRDSFLREIEDQPEGWRTAAVVAYDASRAALSADRPEVPQAQIIQLELRRQQ